MAICDKCSFEYDYKKRKCPQCGEPYKSKTQLEGGKAEETLDDAFRLEPGASKEPAEPSSPTMDREDALSRQVELAKEKQAILLKQKAVKDLEDRLASINAENSTIEQQLATIGIIHVFALFISRMLPRLSSEIQ